MTKSCEIAMLQQKAERGRRLISEMSDAAAYETNENLQAITTFAVWQQLSDLPQNVKTQAMRMAIESAYRLGQKDI